MNIKLKGLSGWGWMRGDSRTPFLLREWAGGIAFFALLLGIGLFVYRDYGLSWDEPVQLSLGIKNFRYMVKNDPALLSERDRYYGPFFELALLVLQRRSPPHEVFYSRHLINFLAFWVSCLGLFGLGKYLFQKTHLALLGPVFLALSPRLFADAFYNSKDIPLMLFYLLAFFSMLLFLDGLKGHRPNLWSLLLHSLLTAAMLAIRLPGLVIPLLTLAGLGIEALARRVSWRRACVLGLGYLVISFALLVAFWPALWPNPPLELWTAFSMMKNFPHLSALLFMGAVIRSDSLPWFYIPVWMAITTPPLYSLLFLLGLAEILAAWLRSPRSLLTAAGRSHLLLLGAIFLPLAAVIGMKSTLYDSWRQMFFIYPPLLLVALKGFDAWWGRLSAWLSPRRAIPFLLPVAAALLLASSLAPVGVWMVRSHPYQNVYFNRLAGPDLKTIQTRYAMDYWGLSYREGLAYVLEHDPSGRIPVFVETQAGEYSASIFPGDQQKRLHFVKDLSQARYYIANYNLVLQYPFKNEIFTVKVENTPLLSVFLLTEEEKK